MFSTLDRLSDEPKGLWPLLCLHGGDQEAEIGAWSITHRHIMTIMSRSPRPKFADIKAVEKDLGCAVKDLTEAV